MFKLRERQILDEIPEFEANFHIIESSLDKSLWAISKKPNKLIESLWDFAKKIALGSGQPFTLGFCGEIMQTFIGRLRRAFDYDFV